MTTFLIIISALFLAVIWLVFSSIRLRLEFDEPVRLAVLSYAFLAFRADLKAFMGQARLFGISVYSFGFKDGIFRKSQSKKAKKKESKTKIEIKKAGPDKSKTPIKGKQKDKEKKKSRSGRSFDYLDLISVKNLQIIKRFIGKFSIDYLNIEIKGGFDDPYRTGQAVASYWAARGMLYPVMKYVHYYPDFDAEKFEFRGKGIVSIRVVHILVLVFSVLAEYLKIKVRQFFRSKKKGLAYG